MRLLIIGGTRFLGRAIVQQGLAAGHEITLFNRGHSNPDLFPQLEKLVGDRDGGLDILCGNTWDAVVDTCGYVPRLVRDSAVMLADSIGLYAFISSISVYAEPLPIYPDEFAPLAKMEDVTVEEITGETYGPLKVLCEMEIDQAMNGRALLVRSGLIVGPHDPTDRFSYWPHRVARGGNVLAPGNPHAPVQFIDVHDLAAWIINGLEIGLTGPYNVTGPAYGLTMRAFLEACNRAVSSDATFTWVTDPFLLENEVAPFVDLPLWVLKGEVELMNVNIQKAVHDGLAFRPLEDTLRDTLSWLQTRPLNHQWRAGLTAEREEQLLELWAKKS